MCCIRTNSQMIDPMMAEIIATFESQPDFSQSLSNYHCATCHKDRSEMNVTLKPYQ